MFLYLNNVKLRHPINIIAKYKDEHLLRKTHINSSMTLLLTNQDRSPETFYGTNVLLKLLLKQA